MQGISIEQQGTSTTTIGTRALTYENDLAARGVVV